MEKNVVKRCYLDAAFKAIIDLLVLLIRKKIKSNKTMKDHNQINFFQFQSDTFLPIKDISEMTFASRSFSSFIIRFFRICLNLIALFFFGVTMCGQIVDFAELKRSTSRLFSM
jgi:hypothetical protein